MSIIIFFILGYSTSLLFPPYFFFPLGFIIFPYLCFYTERKINYSSKYRLFNNIFIFAFGFFVNFLFWLQNPFYVFEETKNLFFLSIVLIIFLSLIFSIIFIIITSFNKHLPTIFLIPLIFILSELIISNIFYGFPWISFSLISSSNEIFSFSLKNFGTLITSYLILQIFSLPYLLIRTKLCKFFFINFSFFCFLPLCLILIFHFFNYSEDSSFKNKINLEIVQLNHKNQIFDNDTDKKINNILNYISKSNSDLIIFAENNYPYLIKNLNINNIQNHLKQNQTVVIGGTRIEADKYYNTLFNITYNKVSYFDKKILVPFGEFLPFRNLLEFLEPISGISDYNTGKKNRIIKFKSDLYYIPIICYEIIFYWKLINDYNSETDFIVNITNDSWFGDFIGPYQHFYFAKLRAAEFNKPVIRVSNNGISGIIDSNGKIIKKTNLNVFQSFKHTLDINTGKNYFKTHEILKIYFFFLIILCIFFNLKKNESS